MKTLKVSSEYFNLTDTLECGQVFRFIPYKKGYKVFSEDKCCYAYTDGDFSYITTDDIEYFENYFDLKTDYSLLQQKIHALNDDFISKVATLGKGIRILKQSTREVAYSFIVSQNNNIPRIKNSIEKLCTALGEKRFFDGEEYYTFPTDDKISSQELPFFKSIGLGYRDEYFKRFSIQLAGGFDIKSLNALPTKDLTKELLKIHGVGKKVADCITFFGFNKTDAFPVDTWIEKIYLENLGGKQESREVISNKLVSTYGELSGYIQQYLFYYKRTIEKSTK